MNPSKINEIFQTIRSHQGVSPVLKLYNGQLITGKMIKFFPGNKALIEIRGHQLVAETDTALIANEKYLMQVKATTPTVQLKVINQQLIKDDHDAAQKILQFSNSKYSKNEQNIFTQLIKDGVPIKSDTLPSLLNLIKDKSFRNLSILKEILIRDLPLTKSTYMAVQQQQIRTISFSDVVLQLQNSLANEINTNEKVLLLNYLNLLNTKQMMPNQLLQLFVSEAIYEAEQTDQPTYQLFSRLGLIDKEISQQDWNKEWKMWAQTNRNQILNLSTITTNLPYQSIVNHIIKTFTSNPNIFRNINPTEFSQSENRALLFWQSIALITGDQFRQSQSFIERFKSFSQLIKLEQNTNSHFPSIVNLIESIKTQSPSQQLSENVNQLQQIIHAVHLSFHDTGREWIHFTIQFPKQLFDLQDDLWMEFEGKKSKDGIDPEFCRVIFYLNLKNLNETVIDLNVQNRKVFMSIYNNKEEISLLAKALLPKLKTQLENKNYDLVNLQIYPYRDTNKVNNDSKSKPYHINYSEGIDFKI